MTRLLRGKASSPLFSKHTAAKLQLCSTYFLYPTTTILSTPPKPEASPDVPPALQEAVEAEPEETTAITENRVRDKAWTKELGLKEFGEPDGVLCDRDGVVLATGYRRIVFGDHGPYMELTNEQVMWNNFPFFRHNDAKYAYFDKCISSGSEQVQLYLQKRTVADKPNPPPGKYSVNNNRPEGYADYRPGYFYFAADSMLISVEEKDDKGRGSNSDVLPVKSERGNERSSSRDMSPGKCSSSSSTSSTRDASSRGHESSSEERPH